MSVTHLGRSDFDFELPSKLIAQEPLESRTDSRLLYLGGGGIQHERFSDLERRLLPGDLLVWNDTQVIPARMHAVKDSGGQAELLLERIESPDVALCQVRVSKPLKPGRSLSLWDAEERSISGEELKVLAREGDLYRLKFPRDVLQVLEDLGQVPLPPYIQRPPRAADRNRYQTIFARVPGAVAAPTAGLHFDSALLERLERKGIGTAHITLHVGAGTFQPLRQESLQQHAMHSERVVVEMATVNKIQQTKKHGGRVVAVGTTVVRALETAALGGEMDSFQGEADLFILPGFEFRVTDVLITNFHLPQSTLLMLVAAFAGRENILAAYREAVVQKYRFFSYGDAMLLEPQARRSRFGGCRS